MYAYKFDKKKGCYFTPNKRTDFRTGKEWGLIDVEVSDSYIVAVFAPYFMIDGENNWNDEDLLLIEQFYEAPYWSDSHDKENEIEKAVYACIDYLEGNFSKHNNTPAIIDQAKKGV